jgi:hypothetical protein
MDCWPTGGDNSAKDAADRAPKAGGAPADGWTTFPDGTRLNVTKNERGDAIWATDLDGKTTCKGAGCPADPAPASQSAPSQTRSAPSRRSAAAPVGLASDAPSERDSKVRATPVQVGRDVIEASFQGGPNTPALDAPPRENTAASASKLGGALKTAGRGYGAASDGYAAAAALAQLSGREFTANFDGKLNRRRFTEADYRPPWVITVQ